MQEQEDLFERLMNDYISGALTEEDQLTFFSMIRQSEEYKQRYKERSKLYALLHVPFLEKRKTEGYRGFRGRLREDVKPFRRLGTIVWLRFAAASVVLMILSSALSVFLVKTGGNPEVSTLCEVIVPLGCQTKVILSDSTVVTLNSGSILRYPASFGDEPRRVYLAGEGYFEVTKNKASVFQVFADETRVEVTGTLFNFRAYPEDVEAEVNLIEGGVNVSCGEKELALKPNEKAVYNRKSGHLISFASEAHKSALWTTGKLSFVNTSFPDMLKSIERKYNIKIHIISTKVRNELFSGTIRSDMPLQEVFNFIDMDKKYRFENSGSTILLKDR